ncbi:MAG: hypothetical protein HXY38_13180, partial [Chloroflexi bacterium]|nr:hypothetical protein [Chloroflexota bacterium]
LGPASASGRHLWLRRLHLRTRGGARRAQQLAAHVLEAVEWMWTYPETAEPQTVIVYAWNELSEGGWLVPTLEEGDARLRAISEALLNR